jgi:hypothetical protein
MFLTATKFRKGRCGNGLIRSVTTTLPTSRRSTTRGATNMTDIGKELVRPTSLYQMLEAMELEKTYGGEGGKVTFGEGYPYEFLIDSPVWEELKNLGEWLIELSEALKPWLKREAVE